MSVNKICVLGLGYVGLPLAVEFSQKYSVIGFDVDDGKIDALRSGLDKTGSVDDENLQALHSVEFTSDIADIKRANVYILAVPTPVDSANTPDLSLLMSATQTVASVLESGDLVIFESTVYPGCTDEVCVPILEDHSGLELNTDFKCGYSPERINPGDKVNCLSSVIKIVSGSDSDALDTVDELYSSIVDAGTFRASSMRVAEAAKVIENTQRDLNVAMVNELSIIFDRLGIDTTEVLDAASTKWNFNRFAPGLVGGHCISVDPYYLTYKAQQTGYTPQVILAGRSINDNMARYAARQVIRLMLKNDINASRSRVGVLGLTFKENCPDTRNSKVFDLISELASWNIDVVAVDAHVDPDTVLRDTGVAVSDIKQLENCDTLILAVAHDEYRSMDPKTLRGMCKGEAPVFADLKSCFDKKLLEALGFSVFRL